MYIIFSTGYIKNLQLKLARMNTIYNNFRSYIRVTIQPSII